MSLRTSATRYAKALLAVAIQESDPARIEADLSAVVDVMKEHADVRRAMLSPAIPQTVRVNVVQALTDHLGTQPPAAKLLTLLAGRARLELLPDLLEVYRERLLAHRNIVRAEVSAAAPLQDDKVQALEKSLGQLTGKEMQIEVAVDPALIGGVVAKIGSIVYDGSIRTQLERLKQQLVKNA